MARNWTPKVVRDGLRDHPAVQAWLRAVPDAAPPKKMRRLRERNKTATYRFYGLGASETVIAKRSSAEPARYEQFLYEQIFPSLPVSQLQFHGGVADADGVHYWIFLEDAGRDKYKPQHPQYPRLGAEWLARFHVSTQGTECPAGVADFGPQYYLQEQLHPARADLAVGLKNPALDKEQRRLVAEVDTMLAGLENHWDELTGFCQRMPHSLFHGDFAAKNVRVGQDTAGQARLLPFDWETAGFGVPAADIALAGDLQAYANAVRPAWPQVGPADLEQLARVGRVFRVLASLHWFGQQLHAAWAHRGMRNLEIYRQRLATVLAELGWR